LADGGCFKAKVHLQSRGLRQRLGNFDGTQAARSGNVALLKLCSQEEALKVVVEAATAARPDHLDGNLHLLAITKDLRGMNLGDGGRGNGLVNLDVKPVGRDAERTFDEGQRLFRRKGRHAVLQRGEVTRKGSTYNVGTGRQELAELHIGGAKPVDGAGQALSTVDVARRATGQEPRHPPAKAGQAFQLVARCGSDDAFAKHDPTRPCETEI